MKLIPKFDHATWCCIGAIAVWLALLVFMMEFHNASRADAAMTDCIDATCRVTNLDGARGTGCCIEIGEDYVYVLTNAHVATTQVMKLEFWTDGHQSLPLIGSTVLRSESRDAAVIAVEKDAFGRFLPAVIPLAPRDYILYGGQTITSVGCAKGAWSTGWKGHVAGYRKSALSPLVFTPAPADGRSGSAVFDEGGTMVVGLIRARMQEGESDVVGLAVNLQNIYAALLNETAWTTVEDREMYRPLVGLVQCGPNGCPQPQQQAPPYRFLPYRQKQDWKDRQQDRRIDGLYPTRPKDPPKAEAKPPVRKCAPVRPPARKVSRPFWKRPTVVACLIMLGIAAGGAVGFVRQWKKTYE